MTAAKTANVVRFVVPGTPLGKGRPRFVKTTGRAFTPKATASYESVVLGFATQAMSGGPLEGPLRMSLEAVYLVPASWSGKRRAQATWKTSKPDIDNVVKLVKDALNNVAYHDDAQIVDVRARKIYGAVAQLTVSVEQIGDDLFG